MAKNIIMNVLTSAGYEPMYPFTPKQVLGATFLNTSTANQYNVSITGIPTPITNSFGNDMGIIVFIPTINNNDNITLSINGDTARQILFSNGTAVRANTLVANRAVLVRYYNNNFYLILDKNQVGLSNVDNTPVLIPKNANLNSYTTAGMYYNPTTADAATIANVPSPIAFSLLVERHAGVKKTFTSYSTSGIQMWVRNFYVGTWSDWYQVAVILSGKSEPNNAMGLNGNVYLKYE